MDTRDQKKNKISNPLDSHWTTHAYMYHWFAFYQGQAEGRNLKAHHLRDGIAFLHLSVALNDRGGRFDTEFHNGPATPERMKHYRKVVEEMVLRCEEPLIEEIVEYDPVDASFLQKGELLAITTRLPMDDFLQADKVQVQPGFTSLEQTVIRLCRKYLAVCSRSRVRLADLVAQALPPEYANRTDIRVKGTAEPWYDTLSSGSVNARARRKVPPRRTAVYLLQLPEVEELNGADLLMMWGQGGTQTLVFAKRLRNDLSYLLDRYGLSMVEMEAPALPPRQGRRKGKGADSFGLLDAAQDWKAIPLLEGVLLDPSGERVLPPRMVRRARPGVRRKKSRAKSVRSDSSGAKPRRAKKAAPRKARGSG